MEPVLFVDCAREKYRDQDLLVVLGYLATTISIYNNLCALAAPGMLLTPGRGYRLVNFLAGGLRAVKVDIARDESVFDRVYGTELSLHVRLAIVVHRHISSSGESKLKLGTSLLLSILVSEEKVYAERRQGC